MTFSIIYSALADRFLESPTILYVDINTPASDNENISSLFLEVNLTTLLGSISVNLISSVYHYSTETDPLQNINVLFLILLIADIPTNVLPAPHGNTIIPERDLPDTNILDIALS